jgi:hypothetical protein
MGFVIDSSTAGPLPQGAMRRLVEVVDACRGQPQVFVVFRDSFPYQAVSVHTTDSAARKAAKAESGLSYFGPVAPSAAPSEFYGILKTTGTTFIALPKSVATVVLLDADDGEVARFPVTLEGLTNPQADTEALFLTPSSVDKYAIPYVSRVYGTEYAAAQRREWIKDKD